MRYADDFVITGNSKELLENEVKPLVKSFLAERGLQLSERKTKITHISEGFDFLGQNVRKYQVGKPNEKLLIKPAKRNVKAFRSKIAKMVKKLGTAKQEKVIQALNPVIRGWANYHRHIVAKEVIAKADYYIWYRLWHWACRRHNNKGKSWVKERYYVAIENRNKVFACKVRTGDGKEKLLTLYNAADTVIVRHRKVRGAANPYLPCQKMPKFNNGLLAGSEESA